MDSYVCKLVVLQTKEDRILKPRKIFDDENVSKADSIKKCLFGVSSPSDTEKMVREQFEIDNRRFRERFGIDLKRLEGVEKDNDENVDGNVQSTRRRSMPKDRRVLKAVRRVFEPCNGQSSMTDFYQAKKSVQSTEKSPKDSKEN